MPFLCAMKDGQRRGGEGGKEQGRGENFSRRFDRAEPALWRGGVGVGGAFEVSYRQLEGCGESE